MGIESSLDLQSFYPTDLRIESIEESGNEIILHMHSSSIRSRCAKCGAFLSQHHGTHRRKAQDLPIMGKRVILDMQVYDYQCTNESCGSFASTETFDGFLQYNGRRTERLEDFMCLLAIETSCESCARIMNSMNVRISGDTIIRILMKRYDRQPAPTCGSVIGVDDFAFKKRHTYGTIIVDEATHAPVAILDGRDGKNLKEWLKQNRHVTTVTRDRASAYAKAVEEVLPECMQVADRFHLHQNLMDAVNKILSREIPVTTAIPSEAQSPSDTPEKAPVVDDGKKNRTHCG